MGDCGGCDCDHRGRGCVAAAAEEEEGRYGLDSGVTRRVEGAEEGGY